MYSKRLQIDFRVAASPKGECPVCFRIPSEKIFQCANGHYLCEQCSSKVTACPTCRSPEVKIRNRLAESLLDEVQFKCNWIGRGCDKKMSRKQLSSHEDLCAHNPHLITFCSLMSNHVKNCQYKFTSIWLSEPHNCTEFINHIKACNGIICLEIVQIGSSYNSAVDCNILKNFTFTSRPAHHYFTPKFYRFQTSSNGKEQLFFRTILLKVDNSRNTSMSWAIVQLTPEITPFEITMTINADVNFKLGQQYSSTLSWIIKPILFTDFKKMVEAQNNTENGPSFPFSVPTSFLLDYYVNGNGILNETMTIQSSSSALEL